MSIDKKLLARAKGKLEERRRLREALYERRRESVYAANPRIREMEIEIKATVAAVIAAALRSGTDPTEAVEEQRRKNQALQKERREELIRAGFKENFLDDSPVCSKCNDTGYDGINICRCLMEMYMREQSESLSSLIKLGNESFENFNLNYYDDTKNENGFSPRQSMEIVYESCVGYANKFGQKSLNLFLVGNPGLGKTYLSACIAKVVSEKGYSVVYNTAGAIFSVFEDAKFSRGNSPEEARDEVRRCMECDLLILDDLGTEMTTSFTISALYELINNRLITGKKTVINSNHKIPELQKRYSDRIMSRLEGEYHVLHFYGSDIRKLKKA